MAQVARNLTDCEKGFLTGKKILLRDRDTKYTEQFDAILRDAGIEAKRLPARSPNLNAYAERWVRTVKENCLERMILFGESSLRRATAEFVEHYHKERNHQGVDNRILFPDFDVVEPKGGVARRKRLGGMLNYYYREAA